MPSVEDFLSPEQEKAIVAAIVDAEKTTSGEIRVHLEAHYNGVHFERAKSLFHSLKMDNTKEENGVLIYVAVLDKKFVILGDAGINKVVPPNFWNSTKDLMTKHFKREQFTAGIIAGIKEAGVQLATHFPWDTNDTNELSNEVSKG